MSFAWLFLVAFVGGALNSVAGGGSFLTLPALIYVGVPAVSANATSTFAMLPASLSSAVAYRREIGRAWAWTLRLGAISLAGGLLGGLLLVRTSDQSFLRLLPWLMALAAATFTFGGQLTVWARARREAAKGSDGGSDGRARTAADESSRTGDVGSVRVPLWTLPLQLLIATYGGYFGGGMGIMMLAALSVAGMTDIHEMNGLKAVLAIAINGVALVTFIASGAIAWAPGLVMVVGGICGGYLGAATARKVAGTQIKIVVTVIAWTMTAYFFIR
ncbi:MAG: sulfite exporter TauE/SafE family protein [Vicinamibacterales bacterium]